VKDTLKSSKKGARSATAKPAAKKAKAKANNNSTAGSMKLILTSHNVTLTDAIESHIVARIEQLSHLDPRAIDARVVIEHDHAKVPERQFKCSIRITEPGPDLFAEDAETDLYAAIDLVAKKIEAQMRKRHNKFKARNHTEASKMKRTIQEGAL
jgi:putative sigma-54 modulation protein